MKRGAMPNSSVITGRGTANCAAYGDRRYIHQRGLVGRTLHPPDGRLA